MRDMKYEVLWTGMKEMLEESMAREDWTESMFSGAFLNIMNDYEEKFEMIMAEEKK